MNNPCTHPNAYTVNDSDYENPDLRVLICEDCGHTEHFNDDTEEVLA